MAAELQGASGPLRRVRTPDGGRQRVQGQRGRDERGQWGIEGDLLVYQQFEDGRSDLKFFDLATRDRSSPPRGINREALGVSSSDMRHLSGTTTPRLLALPR